MLTRNDMFYTTSFCPLLVTTAFLSIHVFRDEQLF